MAISGQMTQEQQPNDPWAPQPPPGQYQQPYQQQPYQAQPPQYDPWAQPPPGQYYAPRSRPTLVTILGILDYLAGIGFLILSLGVLALGAMWNQFIIEDDSGVVDQIKQDLPELIEYGSTIFITAGAILLVASIITFVVAWSLMKGKSWAPHLGLVVAVLWVILLVIGHLWTALVIQVILTIGIYYMLTQKGEYKSWFTQ